jgi:uncharacterized BrkB/YihY/UPF0761 family membrane protein
MWSRIVAAVDGFQRRHGVVGFPVAVLKKFGDDRASNLAALIAYYAFWSIFPLLLAFVSVLGFVLEDNPSLRDDVVDSTLAQIPVLGSQVGDQLQPLTGNTAALVIGLVGALWAGLGITLALSRAFAQVWDVPRLEQPNGLKSRLRGLVLLVVLAVTLLGATAVGGLAIGGAIGPSFQRFVALALALAVNLIVFLGGFAILDVRPAGLRRLLPGAAMAAVGLLELHKALGS